MKTLIIAVLLMIALNCSSQEVDSLRMNVIEAHQAYKAGTGLLIAGAATTTTGLILKNSKTSVIKAQKRNKAVGNSLILVGGVMALFGYAIQIDSHKFVGRAGVTGVSLTYKF